MQRLSFNDNWQIFDRDSSLNPRFAARKHSTMLNTKSLAQITTPGNGTGSPPSSPSSIRGRNVVYEVEGSYLQRCCAVYNDQRRLVAEIRRKESVENDVFRLVVQQEMTSAMGMAVDILLDQMFGRSLRRS
ncbi:hypothetical protein MLD38_029829 [Melastoma candidum]|uniref:Uncharacterized protein n=1 Tax=Melastoma candidum TaxID=119954 RepID=A0ACB9N901_9MYRT|nr:hypothetical protein MLD38_029829 [Melastoma candidum]